MLKFEHMFQPIAIGVVTVSNPEKTALILDAEAIGSKAVGGKGMLLEQGVANDALFVDREFPTEEFLKFNK